MATIYGFTVTMVRDNVFEIDLRDRKVELTREAADRAEEVADDEHSYRDAVLAEVERSAREWQHDRGPDSDIGRHMEEGSPTADHSSDPLSLKRGSARKSARKKE